MPGQVVLISGCSSGIGLLAAVRAAAAGHRVYATMRDVSKRGALDRAAAEARVSLEVRPLDVDQAESIRTCVEGIIREAGQIDVLVNNAGFGMGGTIYDLSMEEIRAQFETNFFGAVALTKAVLPGMIARRQGRIIQVSSSNGRHAAPGVGAYSASKFALEGFTEALYLEVEPFGVRVTSMLPGMFKTEAYQKRRLAKAFGSASSPFSAVSERGLQSIDSMFERNASDPAKVAEVLVKLIDDPSPPLRVVVGTDAKIQMVARALLPERWWAWIIRRAVKFQPA